MAWLNTVLSSFFTSPCCFSLLRLGHDRSCSAARSMAVCSSSVSAAKPVSWRRQSKKFRFSRFFWRVDHLSHVICYFSTDPQPDSDGHRLLWGVKIKGSDLTLDLAVKSGFPELLVGPDGVVLNAGVRKLVDSRSQFLQDKTQTL